LKHSPDMRFRLDETFDKMDETRRMFEQEHVRKDIERADERDDEEE
jgi:ribosome-binding factor A